MSAVPITRRQFAAVGLAAPLARRSSNLIEVPVLQLIDQRARLNSNDLQRFRRDVWDEAVRLFRAGGVALLTTERDGEIKLYPSGRPRITGLEKGLVNIVITSAVPLAWDRGRSVCGVATIYEGYHLSVIAVKNAYPNRLPVLAVNTVVHELLHILGGDLQANRSGLLKGADRELTADWRATRLWLTGTMPGLRQQAQSFMKALRTSSAPLKI